MIKRLLRHILPSPAALPFIWSRISLSMLAAVTLLHIPIELQQNLIYQLVQGRQFIGYINWVEGR